MVSLPVVSTGLRAKKVDFETSCSRAFEPPHGVQPLGKRCGLAAFSAIVKRIVHLVRKLHQFHIFPHVGAEGLVEFFEDIRHGDE
jgi:hypothetical protein